MANGQVIIGIVFFCIISLFIAAVIIGYIISANRASQATGNNPPISVGKFMSSCASDITICGTGLACDGATYTCKYDENSFCENASDCISGYFCSGRCIKNGTATGGLNQYCPCGHGFICVNNINTSSTCKVLGTFPCSTDDDCASGLCDDGTCAAGLPNSYICTNDDQCLSGNCSCTSSDSKSCYCQNRNFTSGNPGSACGGYCNRSNLEKATSSCNGNATCSCNGVSPDDSIAIGICVSSEQGISNICNQSSICSSQLNCYDTNGQDCINGVTGLQICTCNMPYEDPNILSNNQMTCIGGMTNSSGGCYNNVGLGCDSGGQCISGSCSGQSILAAYTFSVSNGNGGFTGIGPIFIGSENTSIEPITAGPSISSTNINPYKMFGYSDNIYNGNNVNSLIDHIYVVDGVQGLCTIDINYDLGINTGWSQIVPTTSVNGTLIDAYSNGLLLLVAFNNGTNDVLLSYNSTTNTFSPFNSVDGTQQTAGGTILTINYVSISRGNAVSNVNNDVLISSNGALYVKLSGGTTYSPAIQTGGNTTVNRQPGTNITNTIGPSSFYFDEQQTFYGNATPATCPSVNTSNNNATIIACPSSTNISYVARHTNATSGIVSNVVLFSGNVAGASFPEDQYGHVAYNVFDYSIYQNYNGLMGVAVPSVINTPIIALATAYSGNNFIDNVVAVGFGGLSSILPYKISTTARCCATANALYVLSVNSCTP